MCQSTILIRLKWERNTEAKKAIECTIARIHFHASEGERKKGKFSTIEYLILVFSFSQSIEWISLALCEDNVLPFAYWKYDHIQIKSIVFQFYFLCQPFRCDLLSIHYELLLQSFTLLLWMNISCGKQKKRQNVCWEREEEDESEHG